MMILMKNILVVIALLAVMLPCSHAVEQNDDNDHGFAQDLCDCYGTYCDCPAGDDLPCANKQQFQFVAPTASKIVNAPPVVLAGDRLYLLEDQQAIKHHNHPVSGVLVSIHTVQLLI